MNTKKKNERTENSLQSRQKHQKAFSMKAAKTDPNGSWTGVPNDPKETPIQDADDL